MNSLQKILQQEWEEKNEGEKIFNPRKDNKNESKEFSTPTRTQIQKMNIPSLPAIYPYPTLTPHLDPSNNG